MHSGVHFILIFKNILSFFVVVRGYMLLPERDKEGVLEGERTANGTWS